jgi:hypothetical protein
MRRHLLLVLGFALLPAVAHAESALTADEARQALSTAVGARVQLQHLPLGVDRDGAVAMKRIEVYAPDAKIYRVEGGVRRELPRSTWMHFIADKDVAGAPRVGLSISPDGRQAQGVVFADDGHTYAVTGTPFAGGMRFTLKDARKDARGAPVEFNCRNDTLGWKSLQVPVGLLSATAGTTSPHSVDAASRSGVLAVDTDNELMSQKFSNNTTTATNYIAALIAGMNVIYERDLDVTLVQGTTMLRTTADPFATTGSDIIAQLNEFGDVWVASHGGVARAFAMQLSGKSSSPNSSAGIAWVLSSPSVNYCTKTASNGGHYSVSQVFKFAGSTAAHDVLVVAHELGHNFGADHTHCSNAATGIGGQSTATIDQCYNGEAAFGCFSGAQVCPAAGTVNGVTNVKGTLMSYCHLSGIGSCTSSEVFATAHRTLLAPKVTNNVTLGCFTASGLVNVIFGNGFE